MQDMACPCSDNSNLNCGCFLVVMNKHHATLSNWFGLGELVLNKTDKISKCQNLAQSARGNTQILFFIYFGLTLLHSALIFLKISLNALIHYYYGNIRIQGFNQVEHAWSWRPRGKFMYVLLLQNMSYKDGQITKLIWKVFLKQEHRKRRTEQGWDKS